MQEKIGDLTFEELQAMIAVEVKRQCDAEQQKESDAYAPRRLRSPLDVPVLDVGEWPKGLKLISREEFYDDDGR